MEAETLQMPVLVEPKAYQIECSAGKGVMPHTDCLQCALSGGNTCGFDYVTLKALYGTRERRPGIHVTDLLGCPLKAYWDKTNPVAEMPHKMLARTIGTAWHKFVETNDEFVECELPVEWDELVGTADIVYRDGRIVDNKTTRWLTPSKLPYGSHALQVNIYAFMLRQMGREVKSLAIQYIDMSGPTKCRACRLPVEMIEGNIHCPKCGNTPKDAHLGVVLVDIPIMTDVEVLEEIHDKIKNLQAAIDLGMAPEAAPSYLCGYCPHEGHCEFAA